MDDGEPSDAVINDEMFQELFGDEDDDTPVTHAAVGAGAATAKTPAKKDSRRRYCHHHHRCPGASVGAVPASRPPRPAHSVSKRSLKSKRKAT